MEQKSNLKVMRFSLILKVIIVVWSFYAALTAETTNMSLFYLVFAIVFAGLFVFQLNYYRDKTKAESPEQTDKKEDEADKQDSDDEKKEK